MSVCDKCGKPVERRNDATVLEVKRTGHPLWPYVPRHLFPTESCEGSPSRAQYLGGPPDKRPGYELDPELVPEYEAAYRSMLEAL